MFDESFVTRYLWSTQTNKMIKATKMVAKMSQTYDIPINYKQLGIKKQFLAQVLRSGLYYLFWDWIICP